MKPWVGNIALSSSPSSREGEKRILRGVKVLTFSTTGSDKVCPMISGWSL